MTSGWLGGKRILPTFAESLAKKAARRLEKLGVKIVTGVTKEKVDENGAVPDADDLQRCCQSGERNAGRALNVIIVAEHLVGVAGGSRRCPSSPRGGCNSRERLAVPPERIPR
jgi:NADPH-dependent 2,4-dienoyl-CoA reductase/sulfur reductase-like enzyme